MNSQKNRQQRINLKTSQNVLPSGSCSKKYSQFNFNAHGSTWNYLFIFSEVCTIQFQNSIGLFNLSIEKYFLVTSKFSLRFASALGIGSQSLARRLYLAFFKKMASWKISSCRVFGWFIALSVEINSLLV